MAYSNIDKPNQYFNTSLWTGNDGTQSITGVGFQPDLVWTKARNIDYGHSLFDIVRGTTKRLISSGTDAESTISGLTSFDSDGFTLGSNANCNQSTRTYVGWNWLANNTSGSSNTDGSITSTVSANTTSGFSIVSYTGNQTTLQTVGHGLGVAPKMIIIKNRTGADAWMIYHASLGVSSGTIQRFLQFNTNAVNNGGAGDFPTAPTSTVFGIGNFETMNRSGDSIIAYCFAEKKGFSKFGSYTGNGSTDGTFVYTGFKPAFVMIKISSTTGNWYIFNSTRSTYNQTANILYPDLSNAEYTGTGNQMDILSNGFKLRSTNTDTNGGTHIYMAFAESPLVGSNLVPNNAR